MTQHREKIYFCEAKFRLVIVVGMKWTKYFWKSRGCGISLAYVPTSSRFALRHRAGAVAPFVDY